jgi:periplasmic copper chaperone A
MTCRARLFTLPAVAAGAVVLMAGPAAAHIEPTEESIPAGAFGDVTLVVPHGCEESPTRQLSVQIPEGVLNVTPQVHPGWTVDAPTEQLADPITDEEGEEITERVSQVTFTAQPGNELQPNLRDSFTIGFKAPDTPGEMLFFKTVQTCVEGETAWIEEFSGDGEEPEHPAPAMEITEATGDERGDDAAEETTDDATDDDAAAAADTDDGSEDDDDSSATTIAVAALAVAVVAILGAGFAVLRTRQSS